MRNFPRRAILPLLVVPPFYGVCHLAAAIHFDVAIYPQAIPFDLLLQVILGYPLLALSRRIWVYAMLHGLIIVLLYLGNAAKLAFFGGPIVPDDVSALRSLLLILDGWQFLAVAMPLAAIAGLLLFNLRACHWGAYLSLSGLALLVAALVFQPRMLLNPLDERFGNSVWDQRSNYLSRGATLYSLQESARFFADADPIPPAAKARGAATALLRKAPLPNPVTFTPRNVHVLVLESFWDPAALKNAKFNEPPLSPEFRELWKQAGYSQAMSPVFGGYTANAEFEALCGFPVVKDNVNFERRLLNQVACLPRLLAERGYRTIASHPNVPAFWNRVNAYRRIGFQSYWSLKEFQQDDMNEDVLSDASLYRQVLEKISPLFGANLPVFNYILTYFGHWPYPLNESRPARVTSASPVEEVGNYANTVYYKSRELMAFLKVLRERDPEGLVLIFGDHLPFLGGNFAGYLDSALLASERGDFTPEMFKFFTSTPLIIIDGSRGPIKPGTVPLYAVPQLLLDLLQYDKPTIMEYARQPNGMQVRPLPGMHFNLFPDGKVEVCNEPPFSPACSVSKEWLADVETVGSDLFIGQQITLPDETEPNVEIADTEESESQG